VIQHPLYSHFGQKKDRAEAERKLGLQPGRKNILFFGLIRKYKGLDILLEAFGKLSDEYQLIIAGEPYGPFEPYQEIIDRLPGKDILFVNGLSKNAEDGTPLFKNISFNVGKEDKIALLGNEMAITALFRVLMEEDTPDAGDFKWGVSITKSYFPHDNTAYFKDCRLSIIDWLAQYSKETTETYLRGFLGRMLFSNESVFKPVNVLSGGEKVRCMFARMMLFGSNFLLLDQPTDHLDLESISAVNNGLSAFKGNLIFTSHDYELVNTVANRIIEITPEGGIIDRPGTYEEYLAWKREQQMQ
jgi:ATPase subunit of ABC transporter with duplicated ATPase domains